MNSVEEEYFRYWCNVGGTSRLQRAFSLYEEMRAMLEFQIRQRHPELTDQEIPWQVARVMYLSDKATQELIDQMEAASCRPPSS